LLHCHLQKKAYQLQYSCEIGYYVLQEKGGERVIGIAHAIRTILKRAQGVETKAVNLLNHSKVKIMC
jgi:hypothetical protein